MSLPESDAIWLRSSALPLATPPNTSNSTTSPRFFCAAKSASVPPIWPAPIIASFFLAMLHLVFVVVRAARGGCGSKRGAP